MRTAGVLAATGFVFFSFACLGACSDDPAVSPAPVPDGGIGPAETGPSTDAADGGTATTGAPKRGTRLAPQFRETADGLAELVGMVDTGLGNVACFASLAEDGVTRCLPSDAPYVSKGGAVYADASCGTQLAVVTAGCAKPTFAIRPGEGVGCDVRATVFDVGAQHTTQIYELQDPLDPASCAPISSDAKKAYYVVGAKRAPADFVKLTPRIQPIAGGVGVTMHDGDDGSTCPQYQLVDVARSHACHEGTTSDSKARCLPAGSGNAGNAFVDGTCMKPAALVQPYDCDPLIKAIAATSNTADNDGRELVFELGAKQASKEIFRRNDQQLCEGPSGGSEDVYERGPEIPPTSFPELAITTAGGTRIVAKRWSAGGVTLSPTVNFHDNMLDMRCAMQTAADGKERCLPQGATVLFSDDLCTTPITFAQATAPAPKYAVAFGSGCPRPFHVRAVGAAIAAPAKVYDNFTGPCNEIGGGGSSATYYALGAEVPPSTFAEITRVIR